MPQIMEMLLLGYGSFDSPDYARVESRRESAFIGETRSRLSRLYDYQDISDNNNDVALILAIDNLQNSHVIYLSLVGNAVYISLDGPDGLEGDDTEYPEELVEILTGLGWSFVKKADLQGKAPFPTHIAEDSATIFNVLFADGNFTPGLPLYSSSG